jgi:hypothetical protein
VSVTNSVAGEKTNAAYCFGLGFDDSYACTFNAASNSTTCRGTTTAYVVQYRETSNGTVGDVFDLSNQQNMGSVVQGPTGSYDITFAIGKQGSCVVNGDVATLCVP